MQQPRRMDERLLHHAKGRAAAASCTSGGAATAHDAKGRAAAGNCQPSHTHPAHPSLTVPKVVPRARFVGEGNHAAGRHNLVAAAAHEQAVAAVQQHAGAAQEQPGQGALRGRHGDVACRAWNAAPASGRHARHAMSGEQRHSGATKRLLPMRPLLAPRGL